MCYHGDAMDIVVAKAAVSKAVSEQSCDQCGNIIASNSTLRMKKRRQKKSYNLVSVIHLSR